MPPPVPSALNTDADWAAAIAWLGHYGLILHVPLRGQVWFERKKKERHGMDASTYDYLKPTDDQIARMQRVREAAKAFSEVLERDLPDGPDKTFAIRNHRTTAMWANVAITRQPDGAPRT